MTKSVAKAVEAGSSLQQMVDGGAEPVKVDEEGGPIWTEPEWGEGPRRVSLDPPSI